MTSALQNRLVGTAIVVAIAVIFLPDLLDGKQETKRNLFVNLPEKPTMKEVKAPADFDTDKVREAATRKVEVISDQAIDDSSVENVIAETAMLSQEEINQADETKVATVDLPQTTIAEEPKASSLERQTVVEKDTEKRLSGAGWVVQLGTFRHAKNVQELLNRLESAGYRAFSRPVKTKSGELTKVFVGPDLQKDKLENALSHLKEVTNLQGKVTPFTVQ